MKYCIVIICILGLAVGGYVLYRYGRSLWVPVYQKFKGRQTVEQVIRKVEPPVKARLENKGLSLPFDTLTLLAFKQERIVEVWTERHGQPVRLKTYPFTGYSGKTGPKLREGDRQIPEGIYRVESLNPNSSYYLSMKVDYPNEFDREMAKKDGRENPGSDIYIHGKNVTVGCIPVGDLAIEELFYLVHTTGKEHVRVIIVPYDMRREKQEISPELPEWVEGLYRELKEALQEFKSQLSGTRPEGPIYHSPGQRPGYMVKSSKSP